jgi:nucleotide-binding universal stress UspA family protein
MRCEEVQRLGSPVSVLTAEADERSADLIAVGSEQKGTWGSLFFGSVGKGLLMGADHSILFGKGPVENEGAINAIFATDHSEYAQKAADWLLSHLPAGFGQVVVLTAVGEKDDRATFEKANHDLAIRFNQQGIAARGEVVEGHPSQAIKQAMSAHKSDLLIVGAQGHGFLERLRIGSLSFEVVVNSPYSVLVIRP